MVLFRKPTVSEYEEALRKSSSSVEIIEEVFREDALYRASAIKEVNTRAKWAGLPTLRWVLCELKDALEKYEAKSKQTEESKTEEPKMDNTLRDLFERNQIKSVQEPFFKQ